MSLEKRVDQIKDDLQRELEEFLKMPSISAKPGGADDFKDYAEWVRDKLEEAGAEARLMETEGHPVVYAEIGSGERTLLSYGHYDVQPPDR